MHDIVMRINITCVWNCLCHFIGSTGGMFISEQNSSILDFKCLRPRICHVGERVKCMTCQVGGCIK